MDGAMTKQNKWLALGVLLLVAIIYAMLAR